GDLAAGPAVGAGLPQVEAGAADGLEGSAWQAVVLGPDGVRHAVTVSGSDGTITANTPLNRR
ncbi:hypothetical protein, partial [Streptomyces sp. NPDC031705]|uniref:hypothetical protein n=1 Tax=Streptomyces sp. NPDC031705 TaxID=3155729 RepID=UPI0033E5C426